ncbi:MAG TPA: hypothetical protein VHG32_23695 [Thermoanaerobaculia bacterium]|jgi:hypothetical protein|nr:hypothetical protein [Thermoanaerobaculia bacterium]
METQPGAGGAGESERPRLVSTLLGHAHVEMALACLGSLLGFSAAPLRLRIHDDGSLTATDRERLAAALGDPEVVSRREADERLAGWLAARPATRAFRAANPLALKLVDVALLAAGAELAYCDSDVLFLRPFTGLFELEPAHGALFMCDPQNAYSVRSWHLLQEPRLRLASRLNSGIIGFRTRWFDPDLVEWFLAEPRYRFAPVWVEQTCWALLAQPAGCRLLDPAAIGFPVAEQSPRERQVALHFVSPVRGLFADFRQRWLPGGGAEVGMAPGEETAPGEPIALRSFAAPRLTAAALAATELRRRLRRLRA